MANSIAQSVRPDTFTNANTFYAPIVSMSWGGNLGAVSGVWGSLSSVTVTWSAIPDPEPETWT